MQKRSSSETIDPTRRIYGISFPMCRAMILAFSLTLAGTSSVTVSLLARTQPDNVMQAAGYDVDQATSGTPKWEMMIVAKRPCYRIPYFFGRNVVSLKLDPATSETLSIFSRPGRGPTPTSPTANLTPEWARQMLVQMNVYKAARDEVMLGAPSIDYDPSLAEYIVSFPRTDAEGHIFAGDGVGFWFDHGTSQVTSLSLGFSLPDPAVTTGTMISEQEATSLALSGLNSRKSVLFGHVPEKMGFTAASKPIKVFVMQRNNMFSPDLAEIEEIEETTGTAVVYVVHFVSTLADPSYTGDIEYVEVEVYVDVSSGELIGGDYAKEIVLGDD